MYKSTYDNDVIRTFSTPRLEELARVMEGMLPEATPGTAATLRLMLAAVDKEAARRAAVIERREPWI
jgi:hypothetical protein